jgi:hypothetical protein
MEKKTFSLNKDFVQHRRNNKNAQHLKKLKEMQLVEFISKPCYIYHVLQENMLNFLTPSQTFTLSRV